MELVLIKPDLKYKNKFMEMLSEFRKDGGSVPFVMHFNKDSFEEIVKAAINNENGTDITPNMERSTTWWLMNDEGHMLGIINIRHRLNEYLENFGGHIGYGIRPTERNKGYATKMLSLALKNAMELGIDQVLITCGEDNIASAKVILKNGGTFEDTREYNRNIVNRYWISNLND